MKKTAAVVDAVLEGTHREGADYSTSLVDQQELACAWSPDTTLTFVNEAYCRYFGKHEQELIGTSFLLLVPEQEREALEVHIRQTVAALSPARSAVRYEHAVQTDAGEVRWQEWSDRAIFDAAGRLTGLQSVGRDITDRKQTEQLLQRAKHNYETLVSNLPGLVYRCRHDENWTMEFASEGCLTLTGYNSDDFVIHQNISWIELVHPDDLQAISDEMDTAIHERRPFQLVYRIFTASGELKWVWEQGLAEFEEDGDFSYLQGFITDITARKQAEQALLEQKDKALITLSSIGDAVVTTGPDGCVEYLNPAAEELTGWSRESATGRKFNEVCRILNEQTKALVENALQRTGSGHRLLAEGNAILLNRYGLEYAVEDTVSRIEGRDGTGLGMIVVFRDVTESRRLQKHIIHQAAHDSLTGLVNRYEFEKRLEELLVDAQNSDTQHALCYMDLDQFKVVNDTCGHAAGDELLCQLATVLHNKVRGSDTLARLGGDEFGILLTSCGSKDAREIADIILQTVQEFRFVWDDMTFRVGASIGVVPVDASGAGKKTLLSTADAACYAAKENGRNRIHYYEAGDTDLAQRTGEMQWVSRIHRAVEEDLLELYFQPIAPVSDQSSVSGEYYEILVRMHDDGGNLIAPGAFLPAAERYNLMPVIDKWVVKTAFKWLDGHPEHLKNLAHCAINLAGPSVSDESFLDFLVELFSRVHVPAEKICFEITETTAIANLVKATRFITTLKQMGCTFALDDFGSGMSSFAYLKNLPVDFLKIEGMFVRDIADDPIDYTMVKSINELAHVMGKQTIAEFVENRRILEKLQSIGVDFAQGYGIARPRPLRDRQDSDVTNTSSYPDQE
ncbi:MAG: EAL domain-containing protein [Thiogranum sp.]